MHDRCDPWLLPGSGPVGFFATAWIAARGPRQGGPDSADRVVRAPYVGLWFALGSARDSAWDAERAAYNQHIRFAWAAILMTIPWGLVFLFAVQRGRPADGGGGHEATRSTAGLCTR
jgi:hypothetical protein